MDDWAAIDLRIQSCSDLLSPFQVEEVAVAIARLGHRCSTESAWPS